MTDDLEMAHMMGLSAEARGGDQYVPREREEVPVEKRYCIDLSYYYRTKFQEETGWPENDDAWGLDWKEKYGQEYRDVIEGRVRCPRFSRCGKCKKLLASPSAELRYPDLYQDAYNKYPHLRRDDGHREEAGRDTGRENQGIRLGDAQHTDDAPDKVERGANAVPPVPARQGGQQGQSPVDLQDEMGRQAGPSVQAVPGRVRKAGRNKRNRMTGPNLYTCES